MTLMQVLRQKNWVSGVMNEHNQWLYKLVLCLVVVN